ncbi:S1C family serine protease [Micromonospora sp. NBC_01813]|uniref:S1C family serine protease n=1 Tax=Micromonospora sp. NBC_01813 TaxID=2975988 RepID=UPI002DD9DFF7|nr:trypsin-like peptidase domain-containing protein [Micromonospora sp. NBC_01813]WSA11470.1 trypsin-like peptidase domain-containing protein [Micromonospora sp. NBC_01813]
MDPARPRHAALDPATHPLPSRAAFVPPWAPTTPDPQSGPPITPDTSTPAGESAEPAAYGSAPGPSPERPGSWAPPADQLRRVVPPPRRGWPGVTALLLVVALAGLAGFQTYQINQLTDRLGEADQRLAQAQGADASRFDLVETRTAELERQVGAAFNPESIAAAALPSVFRVSAGRFTGTAFAVGEPDAEGTNLVTNYHVIESSYLAGSRRVFLERDGERVEATIAAVDADSDVALLRTTESYAGLVPAADAVKSGQQIVVVGAPLGLADTVTIGVVSALREADDGSGPVLQFDAPINPGNSGGPVINSGTQVVGIATAKARDAEGIGLAVPIQVACAAFDIC